MVKNERLEELRSTGDELADAVINHYFPENKEFLQAELQKLSNNSIGLTDKAHRTLELLYKDVYSGFEKDEIQTIKKGHDFFSSNASDIMLMLGFLSLPYCYAAASGAEVLVKSNRILTDPEQRLLETAEFVFDITEPKAFTPEGKGFVSIMKVRLIHASARWYAQNSGWDAAKRGIPVNQEDMAGTNLSFSLIPVRGMRKLGITIQPNEANDYIQFWNVIGKRLGVIDELLPVDNKSAYLLEKQIRIRQFSSSEAGKKLAKSLLRHFEKVSYNTPVEGKTKTFMQFLLGDKVASMIGIEVDNYSRLSFRPFQELMKLKNMFIRKEDNYLSTFYAFKAHKKEALEKAGNITLE